MGGFDFTDNSIDTKVGSKFLLTYCLAVRSSLQESLMVRRWTWLLALVVVAGVSDRELRAQAGGSLASAPPPAYPVAAKAAGIEGKVVLKGVVGTDGKMRDLQVIKGPNELRQAAIDQVMRWVYHPYTHNGAFVEVATTVTVIFAMGGKKEKAAAQAAARAELTKETLEQPAAQAPPTKE
jgi:TonB family protein